MGKVNQLLDRSIIRFYQVCNNLPFRVGPVWIFDSKGFGWKHFTQVKLAIELAKLISSKTYGDSLQDITLLNLNSYGKCMLNLLWNFLSENIQNKIILPAQS